MTETEINCSRMKMIIIIYINNALIDALREYYLHEETLRRVKRVSRTLAISPVY